MYYLDKKIMKIGQRTLKTFFALIIGLLIYVLLFLLNRLLGFKELPIFYVTSKELWYAPTNFYTPFFAGIAVCYAMQGSVEQSKAQAKLRSVGSVIGGYWGFVVVEIFELINSLLNFNKLQTSYYILLYLVVSLGLIVLMNLIRLTKTSYAGFITCLTYLAVTISIRNGGMGPFLFTNNRVLSTIIGVYLAVYVNSFPHFTHKNKNILFIAGLDSALYDKEAKLVPGNLNRIRDISHWDMKFTYMTSRNADYVMKSLSPAQIKHPMIVMNGCAIYHPIEKKYSDIVVLNKDTCNEIENILLSLKVNSFKYVYNEEKFDCYYDNLNEVGSRAYYNKNNETNLKLVKAIIPADLTPSMFLIVEKEEKIKEIRNNLIKFKDIEIYEYDFTGLDGYKTLRIMSKEANKTNALNKLKEYINYDYIVAAAGRAYDAEVVDASDFSFCLNLAPKSIKNKVDYIIETEDSKDIITLMEKIYFKKDYKKYIEELKNEKNRKSSNH